jgi:hypothetical protein
MVRQSESRLPFFGNEVLGVENDVEKCTVNLQAASAVAVDEA